MAIFEEPLSAHFATDDHDPCLILGFEHVNEQVGVMAVVCDGDGVIGMAAPSSLIVDWRYVAGEQRWYDYTDLMTKLEAEAAALEPSEET